MAAVVIRRRHVSAFPVLDQRDKVVGVVTDDDLLVKEIDNGGCGLPHCLMSHGDKVRAAAQTAGELMTRAAVTVAPRVGLADAARLMHSWYLKRLPVVDEAGGLVGIVSRVDLLGVYDRPDEDIRTEILQRVIETDFLLDSPAFDVAVSSGVVTLSGTVPHEQLAFNLLDAVRQVGGVVAVRDRLSYPRH
jgi:CBS-domain-containing membrane protein